LGSELLNLEHRQHIAIENEEGQSLCDEQSAQNACAEIRQFPQTRLLRTGTGSFEGNDQWIVDSKYWSVIGGVFV
jgi:hypothetical protein